MRKILAHAKTITPKKMWEAGYALIAVEELAKSKRSPLPKFRTKSPEKDVVEFLLNAIQSFSATNSHVVLYRKLRRGMFKKSVKKIGNPSNAIIMTTDLYRNGHVMGDGTMSKRLMSSDDLIADLNGELRVTDFGFKAPKVKVKKEKIEAVNANEVATKEETFPVEQQEVVHNNADLVPSEQAA